MRKTTQLAFGADGVMLAAGMALGAAGGPVLALTGVALAVASLVPLAVGLGTRHTGRLTPSMRTGCSYTHRHALAVTVMIPARGAALAVF